MPDQNRMMWVPVGELEKLLRYSKLLQNVVQDIQKKCYGVAHELCQQHMHSGTLGEQNEDQMDYIRNCSKYVDRQISIWDMASHQSWMRPRP